MASACAIPEFPYPRKLLPKIASEACTGSCTSCVHVGVGITFMIDEDLGAT